MQGSSETSSAGLRSELRDDAHTVTETANTRLHAEVDARKGAVTEQAKTLSSALDSAAGQLSNSPSWLRSAFEQGAQTLQRFAESIENKDSRQLTQEVQQLARSNPGTFLAGCAVAGFAAARVIKAGVPQGASNGSSTSQDVSESSQPRAYAPPYDPYTSQGSSAPAFGGLSGSQTTAPASQGDGL